MKIFAAGAFLICVAISGCSSNQTQDGGKQASTTKAHAKQRLEIAFTGPWSFALDSTQKRIVAIAPALDGHSGLYLRATGSLLEDGGVYDIKLTGAVSGLARTAPKIVPGQISAGTLMNLESAYTGTPYVINLPETTSIHTVYKDQLAHSAHFPVPKPSISPVFATKVVFEYQVDATDVELVHHTNETATSSESLDTDGAVDVGIDDDPDYSECDYSAKGAYAAMTKLVGMTHYVDFPDYDESCYPNDPQNPNHGKGVRMKHGSLTAGGKAIQLNLLEVLGLVDTYLNDLKNGASDKDKEQIEKLQALERQVKEGVQGWEPQGAKVAQMRDFVEKLKGLQVAIARSSLSDKAREHLAVLAENLKPLSASGKNCKAPLMLLTVV